MNHVGCQSQGKNPGLELANTCGVIELSCWQGSFGRVSASLCLFVVPEVLLETEPNPFLYNGLTQAKHSGGKGNADQRRDSQP
jgi:hypothetical protein